MKANPHQQIAAATVGDCVECARLLVEQLGEHGIAASAEPLAQVLENVVADGARGFLLLARNNDRIVGVAYVATILSAEHCGPVAWLEELYVVPDHRSQGIGTALITGVVQRARETGMVAIELEVDSSHSRAESLYRRFGFRGLERSRWVRKLTTPACETSLSQPDAIL
ncbi:MAG: GNAT family N-acetyltransferase [Limisphaerales bacterium]